MWRLAAVAGLSILLLGQVGAAAALDVPCVGDCNGDGAVTVNELVLGVAIAQGEIPLTSCAAFDTDGAGDVTLNELIQAVNAALGGCPV